MSKVSMREMLKAGVHFGHQTRYWSPKMRPYIFGERNKIHIINLEQTLPMFEEALNYLGSVAAQGGNVLFVGTKRSARKLIKEAAESCGSYYVNHRWLGGMLTNYKTVKNSIQRLKVLEQQADDGGNEKLIKKEQLSLERERIKLDRSLAGIKEMPGMPDALFVVDVDQEYIAVKEANKLGIPVVAVVDTNCNPDGMDYIIPGNDDAISSINLYLKYVADAIRVGKQTRVTQTTVGDAEDYVEVDDSGQIVETKKPATTKKVTKKVVNKVTKKPVVKKAAKAKPEQEAKPEPKPAKKENKDKTEEVGDKLTTINGIGPVIEGKLEGLGVTTFKQIADWSEEDVTRIDQALAFKGRVVREKWIEQAKELIE